MKAKRFFYVLAAILFALSIITYFYESRSSGLLPIITYPLRGFSIYFLIVGLIVILVVITNPNISRK